MSRKLRVLVITQYFFPEQGAVAPQHRVRAFARHMVEEGNDVTVLCEFPNYPTGIIPPEYKGKWYERDTMDGFDILRVWVKASPNKGFKARMLSYISFMLMAVVGAVFKLPGRYDVVMATSPPLTVCVSGWLIAVLKRAALVLEIRDLWPQVAVALGELKSKFLIRVAEVLETFLYRRAKLIIAVTEGFVDYIGERCGDPKKIALIRNGTVTEFFNPDRTDPGLRARLGLEDKFLLTYAGNIGLAQGLPFFLDLAKEMADVPDVFFLFVGSGCLKDELSARVKDEGVSNMAFHDAVPMSEVGPFLNASDVLLVPLKDDPVLKTFIPSKLFDSLACRKPVILGVDGEARRILEEKGGGLYAEPENIASYRKAIVTLKNDPALRDEMGATGYKWVLEGYTRRAQARQTEDAIRACLS